MLNQVKIEFTPIAIIIFKRAWKKASSGLFTIFIGQKCRQPCIYLNEFLGTHAK